MYNIKLTADQAQDLVMVLGAAQPLFQDLADKQDTPGILRGFFKQYANRCGAFTTDIVNQVNAHSA